MSSYLKSILVLVIAVACMTLVSELLQLFSPLEPVAAISPIEAPVLISCLELQCELNRLNPKLKLTEDGVCGPATMAAWNEVVFNRYSLELWPEKVRIVE